MRFTLGVQTPSAVLRICVTYVRYCWIPYVRNVDAAGDFDVLPLSRISLYVRAFVWVSIGVWNVRVQWTVRDIREEAEREHRGERAVGIGLFPHLFLWTQRERKRGFEGECELGARWECRCVRTGDERMGGGRSGSMSSMGSMNGGNLARMGLSGGGRDVGIGYGETGRDGERGWG